MENHNIERIFSGLDKEEKIISATG